MKIFFVIYREILFPRSWKKHLHSLFLQKKKKKKKKRYFFYYTCVNGTRHVKFNQMKIGDPDISPANAYILDESIT